MMAVDFALSQHGSMDWFREEILFIFHTLSTGKVDTILSHDDIFPKGQEVIVISQNIVRTNQESMHKKMFKFQISKNKSKALRKKFASSG